VDAAVAGAVSGAAGLGAGGAALGLLVATSAHDLGATYATHSHIQYH
jgi:hypothetical protein